MKAGRIRKNGKTLSVIFADDGPVSIAALLDTTEDTITKDFYSIIMEREEELLEALEKSDGFITGDWEYDIPIPEVNQIRDFYAFEDHVKAGRASRGLEMIPEWYRIPVFYYSGTSSLLPCGTDLEYPGYTEQLDFELESAVVIGKEGRDINSSSAKEYVAGLLLMNDWSARDEQKLEMKLNLGPAKSKDFGTSFGPFIVSGSELWNLESRGMRFDIEVSAYVNGRRYSNANLGSMYWSFGDMIERASREVTLKKGDIIMSGTVGTGCIVELGPEKYGWLKRGDEVEFESPVLGKMKNRIV